MLATEAATASFSSSVTNCCSSSMLRREPWSESL
jgi:hypothetical protein